MTFATGTLCQLRAAEEDQTSMALLTAAAVCGVAPMHTVAQHNKHSVRLFEANPRRGTAVSRFVGVFLLFTTLPTSGSGHHNNCNDQTPRGRLHTVSKFP
jgi:hypothetical protein